MANHQAALAEQGKREGQGLLPPGVRVVEVKTGTRHSHIVHFIGLRVEVPGREPHIVKSSKGPDAKADCYREVLRFLRAEVAEESR